VSGVTDDLGEKLLSLSCPVPVADYPTVLLGHGGGGRLSQMLVERMFAASFDNAALSEMHDGAVLPFPAGRLAFSTDSYVIRPYVFPGGDIGSLAVHGTVNDLAMCGARPLALSSGLILEEGLPMEDLWRITRSMAEAARNAGVSIVTGDTKVVDRGKGDGIFVNVSGVGVVPEGVEVSPRRAAPGDAILVSGAIAQHGIAILALREGLEFGTTVTTDSAPLNGMVAGLLDAVGRDVHVLRDPTRGGVASVLNEIAKAAGVGVDLVEAAFPIAEEVRGACEILGLDPLYVANEGKLLAFVAPERAEEALALLRAHPFGREAAVVGAVSAQHPGKVVLKSRAGGRRIVDLLTGDQLPRIC